MALASVPPTRVTLLKLIRDAEDTEVLAIRDKFIAATECAEATFYNSRRDLLAKRWATIYKNDAGKNIYAITPRGEQFLALLEGPAEDAI